MSDQGVNGCKAIRICFISEDEAEVKMEMIGRKVTLHVECSPEEDCRDVHRW